MRAISFYWRWVKTAFTHSIGQSDLWGGIAGTILAVIDHFWPEKQLMSSLSWQIPLWALGTVIALRLISAPYWMAKEDALSGRGTKNKQRVSLSYAGDKTIKHNNGSKHTFLYATNEGGGDAAGTQVKIEEARFRRDGSDIWAGTSIVSRTNMSWGFLPDGDPQKYSTVQLAPGSEPVDFVSGPHNFQLQDGSMQLGFAIRIDPRHLRHVNPAFWEKGTYKFVMQVSALDVGKPAKLTLFVDWDGINLAIRSDNQILETAKVLEA